MKWTLIPFINGADLAVNAAADALKQGEGARVLLIGNGASDEDRRLVERFCANNGGALAWFHEPSLPSLAATWNRGLEFVWGTGAEVALVANNDVAITPDTFSTLLEIMQKEQGLLVTATGVEEEETLFEEAKQGGQKALAFDENGKVRKGGPGFSLFLISREGHAKYSFDENLIPAFAEDVDMHRRMILGGDGDRIFGTNVRYLHLGGQTLKKMSPERRAAHEEMISKGSRAHYAAKWGGPVNQELWPEPFMNTGPGTPAGTWKNMPEWIAVRWLCGDGITTPALFDEVRAKW